MCLALIRMLFQSDSLNVAVECERFHTVDRPRRCHYVDILFFFFIIQCKFDKFVSSVHLIYFSETSLPYQRIRRMRKKEKQSQREKNNKTKLYLYCRVHHIKLVRQQRLVQM